MTKARSIAQVNKAIHKEFPTVNLFKGEGTFFIYSEDDEMKMHIAGMYKSSIDTCHLNQQFVEGWLHDVREIMKQISDPDYLRWCN